MKTKFTKLALFALVALSACTGAVRQDESGVTVKVQSPVDNGPALVRLEVMGEKLIHVSATPEKKFADPESLVVLQSEEQTPFTVSVDGETVTVATTAVMANVSVQTGEVWFTDPEEISSLPNSREAESLSNRSKSRVLMDIHSVRCSSLRRMRLSMASDSIRLTSSTIRERTSSSSSTTRRCQCRS